MPRGRLFPVLVAAALAGCGRGAPRVRALARLSPVVMAAARVNTDLWIGSSLGLTRWTSGKAVLLGEEAGFPKGGVQVRSIFPRADTLWLASNAGVVEFSMKTSRMVRIWTSKDGLGAESVRWVGEARGAIWAGTIFGASRLVPGSRRWKNYRIAQGLLQDHVYQLADDGQTLWGSCINGGLVRYDAGRDRWEGVPQVHALGNKHIYSILAVPAAKALWLGTAGGMNLFHTDGAGWDQPVCDDGYTDYCVRSVALTGEGAAQTLWFGTSYGLYRRNIKTGRQVVLTKSNGLPDDEVTSIVSDGNRLLVTTRGGLAEVVLPK